MKKRWLGILLVLCLLVCFAPAALAAEGEVPAAGTLNEVYVSKGGNDETGEGTQEKPVNHSFEIYISGGGVGNVEFCKKITKTITINGDMFEDDFSGAD